MLESLIEFDQQLLVDLNQMHNPFWDGFMIFVTHRLTWIPLYLTIIITLLWKYRWQGLLPIISLILLAVCTDLISSGFMKPFFARPRPCHEASLQDQLHLIIGCGGKFGFVSSHAANTFGLATFLILSFSKKYSWIWAFLPWAIIVSYSRIYLAKHYPGDIIFGALLGAVCAYIFWITYKKIVLKTDRFDTLKES